MCITTSKSKTVQNACVTCESEIPLTFPLILRKIFSHLLNHSVLTKKLAIKYRLSQERKFVCMKKSKTK